jgi:glycosyltransferase involved in cell wall biosynthesis
VPAETVCAVIPTIYPRFINGGMTQRALISVANQSRPVQQVSIAVDTNHEGSWVTRQRALDGARTDWVAFLDDDDEWYPTHIEALLRYARQHQADYVFSWFDCYPPEYFHDPLGHFGKPWNADAPHHTTITVLVRTWLARTVGFTPPDPGDVAGGEDWRFTLGCNELGKIVHLPLRTWRWHWHPGDSPNTSGQPGNW